MRRNLTGRVLFTGRGLGAGANGQDNAVMAYVARELVRGDEDAAGTEGLEKHAIKKRWDSEGNVIKYVRATRKIIKGDNPIEWGRQITVYINDQLRHNVDVNVIGEDGDVLTLTTNTAGKAAYWNTYTDKNGNKRRVSKEAHKKKLGAEAHIDELLKISYRSGNALTDDTKNHPFAKDGWDYRQAYFVDYDGTPYRVTISVGYNNGAITAYNVGKMNKTAFAEGLKARAMLQNKSAMEENAVSITNIPDARRSVNSEKKSLKDTEAMDFFAQMSSDEYVRDAGKLISRLEEMRKKTAFTTGAWKGSTVELSKKLLEETHSGMNQGALCEKQRASRLGGFCRKYGINGCRIFR